MNTFPSQIRRKSISNQLRGLLEVEPLHFTCCAASEATRVEKMDSVTAAPTNSSLIDDIMMPMSSHHQSQPTTVEMGGVAGVGGLLEVNGTAAASKADFDKKWAKVKRFDGLV